MIDIRSVQKNYGKQRVLSDISLAFAPGQSVALIGPNGSGKTTLIKIILGMVIPDSGEVSVNGALIKGHCKYRKDIGYMPQIGRFPDQMNVRQLFDLMKSIRGDVHVRDYDLQLYESFEIGGWAGKKLGALSGGMRQKVSAALAFLFNPRILILDEPTAALDPVSNEVFKEKLKVTIAAGKLILITSHILNELDEITTHVAYLMEGKIQFYRSLELLKSETSESRLNRIVAQLITSEKEYV